MVLSEEPLVLNQGTAKEDLLWFLRQIKPRKLRTMRQFAEEEIVLPSGPFAGSRFRCYRQPYTGLWFDEVDSGRWSRLIATGPSQSGKTVACFVIPLAYHLFEIGETVICGIPDMDMASDKWREDILPIIERSRYRDLLPNKGAGSRGGSVQSVQFRNGATLRFMSGGGGDKSRAGFTSRVVVITETDGMDEQGRNSREADKISQLIARTRAYGSRSRIYMECTVSTETGRTWREYRQGSRSRIALPCPHCRQWVSPEREHLVGWQESQAHLEAMNASRFVCPACSEPWSDQERTEANHACRLVHSEQQLDEEGNVTGDAPATDTLGFRWSAVNNLFLTPGEIGADEWRASRSPDEENAERERRQFVWCVPITPSKWQDAELETHELSCRTNRLSRGMLPGGVEHFTAAMDLGKYLNHWILLAWTPGPVGHVIDYGRIEVASEDLGVEQATMVALRQFREMVTQGWPVGTSADETKSPTLVFIDAGYMTDVVYAFCRESGNRFVAAVGRGASQQHRQWYNRPKQTGAVVKYLGEGYHFSWLGEQAQHLVEIDSDHWKSWAHQRLCTPVHGPGSITLFHGTPQEHLAIAKHLTSEVKTEEFVPGKGIAVKWERKRRQNHWFDALYNACAAGHYCGVRLVAEQPRESPQKSPEKRHSPSEPRRPFVDVERWRENNARLWRRR